MIAGFKNIKPREKLVDIIVRNVKDSLMRGELKPGDMLPSIATLAASMNVGVSSVREAMKMLEALCVVEIKQGEGTFVCKDLREDSINPLSFQLMIIPRNTGEMLEFRKLFETAYTLMAMQTCTDEDLEHIRAIVEAHLAAFPSGRLGTDEEMAFHMAVLNATHNKYVMKIGEAMLELSTSTFYQQPVRVEEFNAPESHMKIYVALRDKDEAALRQALEDSFTGWKIKYFTE